MNFIKNVLEKYVYFIYISLLSLLLYILEKYVYFIYISLQGIHVKIHLISSPTVCASDSHRKLICFYSFLLVFLLSALKMGSCIVINTYTSPLGVCVIELSAWCISCSSEL